MTVYYVAPDSDEPSGGMRVIYRHVDILNRSGIPAAVLHRRRGFRCTWFENNTAVAYAGLDLDSRADVLVLPEIYINRVDEVARGVPKVVFNQNAYLTFRMTPWEGPDAHKRLADVYRRLLGVLVVSDDSAAYLAHAFPGVAPTRIHLGFDIGLWHPADSAPERIVSYMPRRRRDEAHQVLHILRERGVLEGWSVAAIHGATETQVADTLRRSALFLSFGKHEGCPVPPLEAMACGCHVIGFDGFGGAEYFVDPFAESIPDGDVVGFARSAERFLASYPLRAAEWQATGRKASAFVHSEYAADREATDVVTFYRDACARLPDGPALSVTLTAADLEPRPPWPNQVARALGLARLLGRGDSADREPGEGR